MSNTNTPETIEPNDLNSEITKLCSHIQIALLQVEEKYDLEWHLEKTNLEILSGKINRKSVEDEYNFNLINEGGIANYRSALRLSSIFISLAKTAQYEKRLDAAWSFVCKANYQAGIMRGALTKYKTVDAEEIRTKTAKSGGEKKAERYAVDKQEVIRLIREKMPEEGWESPESCFEAIRNDLIESINKRSSSKFGPRPGLNPKKLSFRKTVTQWLKFDVKKMREEKPQSETYFEFDKHSKQHLYDPNNPL